MNVNVLPVDSFSEKTILGLMLIYSNRAIQCVSELEPDDFYADSKKNRKIFEAMLELNDQDKAIDATSVVGLLSAKGQLDAIGGVDYLNSCINLVTNNNDDSVKYYINNLRDIKILRNLFLSFDDIIKDYNENKITDFNGFVANAERKISDITKQRRVSGFVKSDSIARELVKDIEKKMSTGKKSITGYTCGFSNINQITNGFNKGEVTILAARPSVGKTALALNMCYHTAAKERLPVAIFSLEMNNISLMRRLFACVSRVDHGKILTGDLTPLEKAKLLEAQNQISQLELFIDDTNCETLENIIAKATKLKNDRGQLGLIMIDYVGLISLASRRSNMTDQEKVKEISKRLKGLAGDLDCPILLLSQLSRNVDARGDKKPQISDLRDSGSLEQDADVVMLIYRPGYYKAQGVKLRGDTEAETKSLNDAAESDNNGDLTQIIVAKNRNGKAGTANLLFFKNISEFSIPGDDFNEQFNNLGNSEL